VAHDIPVFSNAKNYRMTDDVPLVVPTVNSDHLRAIPAQRQRRNLRRGFLVCNANCSTTGLVVALRPLEVRQSEQEEQGAKRIHFANYVISMGRLTRPCVGCLWVRELHSGDHASGQRRGLPRRGVIGHFGQCRAIHLGRRRQGSG